MVYEQEQGQIMVTVKDVRVWRLYFKGRPSYTRKFTAWREERDVRNLLRLDGEDEDLVSVELVT